MYPSGNRWPKRPDDPSRAFWHKAKEIQWVVDGRVDGDFFLWKYGYYQSFSDWQFLSLCILENFIGWLLYQASYTLEELRPYWVRVEHTKKVKHSSGTPRNSRSMAGDGRKRCWLLRLTERRACLGWRQGLWALWT